MAKKTMGSNFAANLAMKAARTTDRTKRNSGKYALAVAKKAAGGKRYKK